MKKLVIVALFTLFNFNCYSQIAFEDGYFIKDSGEKVDCLIKNVDWKNNPTTFEYKLSEGSKIKTADISSVEEFGVKDFSKFERHTVKIDRSSAFFEEMSIHRKPDFEIEELYLELLVEGKATLYRYEDGNLIRYFYQVEHGDVKQLVYKKYKSSVGMTGEVGARNQVRENNLYRQQLLNKVNCKNISIDDIEGIDYKESDLVNHFVKYNNCFDTSYTNFNALQQRDKFNLNVRTALNRTSLVIHNDGSTYDGADFGGQFSFKIGAELEFILPFNKNMWSIIAEPTYQYYTGSYDSGFQVIKSNYHSIELPLGVRRYFFLNNDKSKIFLNGYVVPDFDLGSTININPSYRLDINSGNNLALGAGYNYNNLYSIELRYMTNRQLLDGSWSADFSGLSLIFGYNLF